MILRRLALLSTVALLTGCSATTPEPVAPLPVVEVEVASTTTPDDPSPSAADEREEAPPKKVKQELTDDEAAHEEALKQAIEARILGELQAGKGNSIGQAQGLGRLGLKGTGTSAGGSGIGLGTIGKGSRGGGGSGYGAGMGSRSRRQTIELERPTVLGALDKNIIRRIVRQQLPKFRYCYERQLAKDPDLAGKLVLKFVIGSDGAVTKAAILESLQPDVDSCVSKFAAQMVFPEPKGKGIVIVRYPFVFSAPQSKTPKASPKKR